MDSLIKASNIDLLFWRVVIETNKSLEEVENYWSLDDILDAIEYLDIKAQIETLAGNMDNHTSAGDGPSFNIKI